MKKQSAIQYPPVLSYLFSLQVIKNNIHRLFPCFVLLLFFLPQGLSAQGTWTEYTNGNWIWNLAADGDYIWASTEGGAVRWDITTDTYTKILTVDGLPNNSVRVIEVDESGNKWFGTESGLTKYNGSTWLTYTTDDGLPNNSVRVIDIDKSGNLWFGTYGGGAGKFDGSTFTNYSTSDGLADNYIFSIAADTMGTIWFSYNFASGVTAFDGSTWTNYDTADGLAGSSVRDIEIDSANNKWFATNAGVSKFDGSTWTTYNTSDGLANNSVQGITIDTTGALWFSTNWRISKFDGSTWTTYTTTDGLLSNSMRQILADDGGNIWAGNLHFPSGLNKFDGSTWSTHLTSDELVENVQNSVVIDASDNIWIGTRFGAQKFDGATWTTYTTADGLAGNNISEVAIEPGGDLWFATLGGGVSNFDGTTWTTYTTVDGLADDNVTSLAIEFSGTKWFGTYGAGVSEFDGTTWTTYTTANGLASDSIIAVAVDSSGNKWFGTNSSGVSKFDGTTWTTYNTGNGLVNNLVISLGVDPMGNIWIGTNSGLSMFDETTWTTYTTSNGLLYSKINAISFDAAGNKWFGLADPSEHPWSGFHQSVSAFDGANWFNYPATSSLLTIDVDSKNDKWIGTWGGLFHLETPAIDSLAYHVWMPDSIIVGPGAFPGDTITIPIYLNPGLYPYENGIFSYQTEVLYNDSLLECIGYDSTGTVLGNYGGLAPFSVQFRKDTSQYLLDTLRFAAANNDSLYAQEVPGTAFEYPKVLVKFKFRIRETIASNVSSPLNFIRFLFNEGFPGVVTDNGSITLQLRRLGDVDQNGLIQPFDAVLVLRHVIKDTTLGPIGQIAAEVSANGTITAFDAALILMHYVGKIATFPAGDYFKRALPSNRGAELVLEWGELKDGMLTLLVNARNLTEVYGYSMELSYDPASLVFQGAGLTDWTQGMINVLKTEDGFIRFAAAGTEPVEGDGALVRLTFRVTGELSGEDNVQLTELILNEELILSNASSVSIPKTYALEQNYPNPFNPTTHIRYQIPEPAQVQIVIYNTLGQRVRTLINEQMTAGAYDIMWDGTNDNGVKLASGVYIYRMRAGNFNQIRKLVLVK